MSDPYIGEIRMFGGNFAPNGWFFCDGQLLAISEYDTLFNLIGTTYGGDGQNTFALPDLRSRVPLHTAAGYPLGAAGGAEAVALTVPQLPAHSHAALAASTYGGAASAAGKTWSQSSLPQYSTAALAMTFAAGALGSAGNGQAHDNMPPFLGLNFIISMFGIYPSPA